jgi:AcrR family transcriptional regulator
LVWIISTGRFNFNKAAPKQIKKINFIARVSSQLFATKGYLETSMEDIAAAAKVTKGGIYHYFASKSDVLYFICSTYIELDLENLEKSLRRIETTSEKIKFIIFRHIEHYTTHVFSAKTLLHEASNLPRSAGPVRTSECEEAQGCGHGIDVYPLRHAQLDLLLVQPERSHLAQGTVPNNL